MTNENISNDGEGFVAGGGGNNHLGHSGVVILTLSVQEIVSINAVITMKEVQWALNEFDRVRPKCLPIYIKVVIFLFEFNHTLWGSFYFAGVTL